MIRHTAALAKAGTRLLTLAFLTALAQPAQAQTEALARADGELAANWQHVIDLREAEYRKGAISREKRDTDKAAAEATIARLRRKNAESPLKEAFEKEYQARLRIWRGQSPPLSESIGQVLSGFRSWGQYPWVSLVGMFLLFALGGAVLLGMVYFIWSALQPRPHPETPLSDVHGSASWAAQITSFPKYVWAAGVFFGKSSTPDIAKTNPVPQDPGAPVYSRMERHTLIVATTRTGKGTRVIIPTLAKYFGSMLVIDPKGENAAVTARERARWQENDVHILNPWGELAGTFQSLGFAPATYNPLDILDRDDPNAVAIAQSLAAAVCPRDAKGKDAYWSDAAASFLTAVLLWLTDQPGETRTLARAREIVTLPRTQLKEKFLAKMSASEAFGGAIRENAGGFIDLAPETYSGVMSNLAQHTRFLSDPQIKAATSASSFSMETLVRIPATVYLVIPPDRMETQRTWLRLMIAAGMHTFKRARQKGEHRCMFLIDEFPALGPLDELPREIATMAGYGVDFTLIVQGLDQLKAIYGDAHETIVNNCAYKWFCNVADLHSAEYLSRMLGKATVQTHSESQSRTGSSVSTGETGRPLLMPDEILTLGRETAILIQPGTKPLYLRPVDYWQLGEAFAMYRELEPQMYWQPAPQFDPNPYHAAAEV